MLFCVLPDSSLCQNGKQVEIITKMIFELCYIEAIICFALTLPRICCALHTFTLCKFGGGSAIKTKVLSFSRLY